MQMRKINKNTFHYINSFPKTNKTPHAGEVWLALFPFDVPGGMQKMRPVLINEVIDENNIKVQMISTNPKNGIKIKNKLGNKNGWLGHEQSYLKKRTAIVDIYKLYSRVLNEIELE